MFVIVESIRVRGVTAGRASVVVCASGLRTSSRLSPTRLRPRPPGTENRHLSHQSHGSGQGHAAPIRSVAGAPLFAGFEAAKAQFLKELSKAASCRLKPQP